VTEPTCRYVDGEYTTPDGETCDVPKREHCTARKTCAQHLAWGELTCGRCRLRTRNDLRQIVQRAALMLPEAMESGVNSEAAMLAGPAANYEVFSARRNIDRQWIMDHIHKSARGWCDQEDCTRRHFKTDKGDRWHKRGIENAFADLVEDDDEFHPYSVTTRWAMMLAEDYSLDLPAVLTISNACEFLERILSRVANDEEQDYRLMASELRRCRQHLEAAMRDSQAPERGAFCPTCKAAKRLVRLNREYSHWCEDPDCTQQFHPTTDDFDVWVCPADKDHWWTAAGYGEQVLGKGA
jgi:hypothetical protein